MELISRRIDHEVDILNWNPISISRKGSKVSHLFFADDLTLFARADAKNCQTILNALQSFSHYSRKKTNTGKSKVIFYSNCTPPVRQFMAYQLSIKASDSFGKYLGFPIFHYKPNTGDFYFIVDILNSKLA